MRWLTAFAIIVVALVGVLAMRIPSPWGGVLIGMCLAVGSQIKRKE